MNYLKYRMEIDGLRAVALLPVLFYHAGFSIFKGGFIGVDIFFVISGYLITSIILSELKNKTFSFINFYERRVRRIIPALFLVLFFSSIISWLYLVPIDSKDFFISLRRVLFFISNIYFSRHSGYFDAASETKPLIHTWSLSIEEQYYLIFPFFIFILWKFFKNFLLPILIIIFFLSLLYCQHKVTSNFHAAFYLFSSRAWEFCVGSIIAYYLLQKNKENPKKIDQFFSFIGFSLIFYSILNFDKNIPLPSFYTIVPVLGAALVIIFANPDTLIHDILLNSKLRTIGLASYSSYLWHQPLLAFSRHLSLEEPSKFFLFLILIFSLVLGYFSWKYFEKIFRDSNLLPRYQLIAILTPLFIALLMVANYGSIDGFKYRFNKYYLSNPEKIEKQAICNPSKLLNNKSVKTCFFGDLNSKTTILVWGDSHAQSLLFELDRKFKENNLRGLRAEIKNCDAIPGLINPSFKYEMMSKLNDCSYSFSQLKKEVFSSIDAVVISVRWTPSFLLSDRDISFNNGEGGVDLVKPSKKLALDEKGEFSANLNLKNKLVLDLVDQFVSLKKRVILVYPVPEMGWDISKINLKKFILLGENENSDITISFSNFKNRNLYVYEVLDSIKSELVYKIKPEIYFCNSFINGRCLGQHDNNQYYSDSHHLSNKGSEFIVSDIMKILTSN